MRYILSLLVCVALSAGLAGCTEDNTGTGSNPSSDNDSGAADTVDDAGDTTEDDSGADGSAGECTDDDDCTGGAHQSGICDLGTNTCTYRCDQGWDNCDGDTSNGCEADITSSTDHCGSCGTSCDATSLQLLPICTENGCDVDSSQCLDGYVNLNGDGSDGCECAITDANDMPDPAGEDANCDGIDGQVEMAVFVSADNGDDEANDGLTPDSPLASITAGLQAATDNDRVHVLVSGGTYTEAVTLRSGISIYGGYDAADGWARDTANQITRIEADADDFSADTLHFKTVSASGITDPTTLDHLTIAGIDASAAATAAPGASSYALWARDSDALSVTNNKILGGKGAKGKDGEKGTTASCSEHAGGTAGGSGAQDSPCGLPSNSTAAAGVSGLPTQSGGGSGGLGGTHACMQDRANCTDALDGADGLDGAPGAHGANGETATDAHGSVDTGNWVPSPTTAPADGARGAGGGGGGAGANCEDSDSPCNLLFCPDNVDVGGSGGSGGAGGCQGTAGENGQSGGGSFGIFAVDSDLTVEETDIDLGHGGNGGIGGNGGDGADGTDGVDGQGGETNDAGEGGWGGDGGDGGNGGAGAGGCGGPSIGLAMSESTIDQSSLSINQATGEAGEPGQGGTRTAGGNAEDGCTGTRKATHDFSADSGS